MSSTCVTHSSPTQISRRDQVACSSGARTSSAGSQSNMNLILSSVILAGPLDARLPSVATPCTLRVPGSPSAPHTKWHRAGPRHNGEVTFPRLTELSLAYRFAQPSGELITIG